MAQNDRNWTAGYQNLALKACLHLFLAEALTDVIRRYESGITTKYKSFTCKTVFLTLRLVQYECMNDLYKVILVQGQDSPQFLSLMTLLIIITSIT